jgi:hypothetical protein
MKRSTALLSALSLLLLLCAAAGFAQGAGLAVTAAKPVVDGVVHPGEYSFTQQSGPLTLSASRSADTLYLAVTAKTDGWVAVGLGSLKMNGSMIFMGFVGTDGKAQFKPQAGSGHAHKDASVSVSETVISSAIKEADGVTTMEIALKAGAYVKSGQQALELILAVGEDKSFVPYHSYRNSLSLKLG